MSEQITYCTLNDPAGVYRSPPLPLRRVPTYLRFVCRRKDPGFYDGWDALDQLDDQPEDGELVLVARLVHRGCIHLDKTVNGRRVGEWRRTAEYRLMDPQPKEQLLRDTARWRMWVINQPGDPEAIERTRQMISKHEGTA
jgi:hypothetical protein